MSDEDRESEKGKNELEKCIEELKMVTRRYARKQNKWTNNRFLGRRDREVGRIILFKINKKFENFGNFF